MNSFTGTSDFWTVWGVLLLILIVVPVTALRLRRRRWAGKWPVFGKIVIKSEATDAVHPGIDPADYATATEQQAALDRLSLLPQFRLLTDGTLVEWGSGARVTPCDCSLPPVPHLMVSWGLKRKQGIVTKNGLAHYVGYQERVAAGLLASPLVPATMPDRERH